MSTKPTAQVVWTGTPTLDQICHLLPDEERMLRGTSRCSVSPATITPLVDERETRGDIYWVRYTLRAVRVEFQASTWTRPEPHTVARTVFQVVDSVHAPDGSGFVRHFVVSAGLDEAQARDVLTTIIDGRLPVQIDDFEI